MRGEQRDRIIGAVLGWYKKNKRDLPWRRTHDPYYILISEIMLQQTQVPRVIEKYTSFIKRFPTLQKLARARTATVITEWKGLGYNRRALFLQRTAQAVVKEHEGKFPKNLETLKSLPGIGDYTARAILSFAFKEKVAMMDVNHRKFYARIFPNAKNDKELLRLAEDMLFGLTRQQYYNWNQGLMDFRSALAKGETGGELDWFLKKYPPQETSYKNSDTSKKKKKPFKETDRYVRGRIIDLLREEKKVSLARTKKVLNVENEKFERVIQGLIRDGLIKQVQKSIMLP